MDSYSLIGPNRLDHSLRWGSLSSATSGMLSAEGVHAVHKRPFWAYKINDSWLYGKKNTLVRTEITKTCENNTFHRNQSYLIGMNTSTNASRRQVLTHYRSYTTWGSQGLGPTMFFKALFLYSMYWLIWGNLKVNNNTRWLVWTTIFFLMLQSEGRIL